ncbi:hypothetical protein AAG906_034397 [Vitis piasezkii]
MGRRKIEIKKIESKDRLMVTFSKRRAGLFKKAQQLSQLSGQLLLSLSSHRWEAFHLSSGGNFDETIASFQGAPNPPEPLHLLFGGNFDETFDPFLGDQVPEFTSQPLWWETDLSSQPTGTLSPPLLVETLMRRWLLFGRSSPESTSQPLWWETDLSSQPTGTLAPPLRPEFTSQPLWWETDLSSQPTGTLSPPLGRNFDETIASFQEGGQVPESTSQPLWWETDLSSQPTGNPFISSSGGNFDETIASFQEINSQPTGSLSPPLLVETLMRRLLLFGRSSPRIQIPTSVVGSDLSCIADLDQLQACKESLLKLRENVWERIQQLQHRKCNNVCGSFDSGAMF